MQPLRHRRILAPLCWFRPPSWPGASPGRILVLAAFVALAVGGCSHDDGPTTNAREAYVHYCASCHGMDGRGDGPLADDLKRAPTDLTGLARAGGFDEKRVLAAIVGQRRIAEHGPAEMPVWGDVFKQEISARDRRYPLYTALLTAQAMTEYLRGLQEP